MGPPLHDDLEARILRNTRELKLAVRRLEDQNASLEEFVYIASHDLQEPVRTIMGYLQLLQSRYGDVLDGDGQEFLDFALDGANHLQSLIEGLLVFSRFMSSERDHERFVVSEAVEGALLLLSHRIDESRAQVDFDRDSDTWAMGDVTLISQVIQNLVDNAIKFSEPPARVTIRCTVEEEDVHISVADEGQGFDARHRDRVFKMFRRLQRDDRGTGIGLAVCKKIVERHDGEIWAESEPGVGTTITFSLPRT